MVQDGARIFPQSCGAVARAATCASRTMRGHETWIGNYEWEGFRYVPSGGSMFEALMPTSCDEPKLAPKSLGENDRAHALVQKTFEPRARLYPVGAVAERDAGRRGLPRVRRARARHARLPRRRGDAARGRALRARGRARAAVAALRSLAADFPIYGEYGLRRGSTPSRREVAYTYLALDQSMLFLAVANHLSPAAACSACSRRTRSWRACRCSARSRGSASTCRRRRAVAPAPAVSARSAAADPAMARLAFGARRRSIPAASATGGYARDRRPEPRGRGRRAAGAGPTFGLQQVDAAAPVAGSRRSPAARCASAIASPERSVAARAQRRDGVPGLRAVPAQDGARQPRSSRCACAGSRDEITEAHVAWVADVLDIAGVLDRVPRQLSGGAAAASRWGRALVRAGGVLSTSRSTSMRKLRPRCVRRSRSCSAAPARTML